jgi:hypothetical protein
LDLREKQEQFEYRKPADLYPHGEPFSPEEWNRTLAKIAGVDKFGDPRYRIVWGGTATKKGYIQTDTKSEPANVIKYPANVPRYRKLKGFEYVDDDGRTVTVTRQDLAPAGKFVAAVVEEYELGTLRWMLERKFTPEELIAMQMYPDPNTEAGKTFGVRGGRRYIAPMDGRGEYIPLYPLQTPDGRYWEPTEEWFDLLRKTEKETREATEGDRMAALNRWVDKIEQRDRRLEIEAAEEDDAIFEEAIIEAEKAPKGRIFVDQHTTINQKQIKEMR